MEVYIVIEYNTWDKSTTILCVFDSKKKALKHLEGLKGEEIGEVSEYSFKEFEVG